MTKRLLAIYLVLLVLLAAMVPSCAGGGGGGGTGIIYVKATLCGNPWQGAVKYTVKQTGGWPVTRTTVPDSFGVPTGTFTCANVSGGPAGAFLNSITPSATQSVSRNGTTTFTLNFELNQDAAIQWLTWTVNRVPWESPVLSTSPSNNIIDAHFMQWVNGCEGYNVTTNEMSRLAITQIAGPAGVVVYVVNDPCATNKTPAPLQKVDQVPSINGLNVPKGANTALTLNVTTGLDVRTDWQLVKGINYTKAISWFGISLAPFEPEAHLCVLFQLVLPVPKGVTQYVFQLQTTDDVALDGDTDVYPANNHDLSGYLTLVVNVL
jgi:hypothetical protein